MVPSNQIAYHFFTSYTTRDGEVQLVQPFVDEFLLALRAEGLRSAPFFYDHLTLGPLVPSDLWSSLVAGVSESVCMISFVSEGYLASSWCMFEWGTMVGTGLFRGPEGGGPPILAIVFKGLGANGEKFLAAQNVHCVYVGVDSLRTSFYEDERRSRGDDFFHCVEEACRFVGRCEGELRNNRALTFSEKLGRYRDPVFLGRYFRLPNRFT